MPTRWRIAGRVAAALAAGGFAAGWGTPRGTLAQAGVPGGVDSATERQRSTGLYEAGRRNRASRLVAMVRGTLGDAETFGAGIVLAWEGPLLYVATANHVVRRAGLTAAPLTVRLRDVPGVDMPARVLPHADAALDLAVLAVAVPEGDPRAQVCELPPGDPNPSPATWSRYGYYRELFRRRPGDLTGDALTIALQGTPVYPVGHPNGVEWAAPVAPDLVAGADSTSVTFQSSFVGVGHSGGALLLADGRLVGMIRQDAPPFAVATRADVLLARLRQWGYPVWLHAGAATDESLMFVRPVYEQLAARLAAARDTAALRRVFAGACGAAGRARVLRDAMTHAAERGDTALAGFLRALGASADSTALYFGDSPLHVVAKRGDTATLRFLLARGAAPDGKMRRTQNWSIELPLATAVLAKQPGAARVLRRFGADPNAAALGSRRLRPPLHFAAYTGDVGTVVAFLDLGASAELRDSLYGTPLQAAAEMDQDRVAQALLDRGARVDEGRPSPLLVAARSLAPEAVRVLLAGGARVDARDDSTGATSLVAAVDGRSGFAKARRYASASKAEAEDAARALVVRQLLAAGADVNARDAAGQTALAHATRRNWAAGVALLRGAGAR